DPPLFTLRASYARHLPTIASSGTPPKFRVAPGFLSEYPEAAHVTFFAAAPPGILAGISARRICRRQGIRLLVDSYVFPGAAGRRLGSSHVPQDRGLPPRNLLRAGPHSSRRQRHRARISQRQHAALCWTVGDHFVADIVDRFRCDDFLDGRIPQRLPAAKNLGIAQGAAD